MKVERYGLLFTFSFTAVPLMPHRHAGLDPVSSKSLKLLDSGLRRNDGEMLSIVMSPTPLGSLHPKHYDNDS
ncbi:MAG: hypothetical protein GXP23_05755, partial [Gammaproteobacteria bacterium]|nr:hypothetical protein [Gammaproteobacteria bacterium]